MIAFVAILSFLLIITPFHTQESTAKADISTSLLSVVSTPLPEYGLVISPDGDTAVFARMSAAWGTRGNKSMLYVTHKHGTGWTIPKPIFGDTFSTGDPFFSADGTILYFTSNQALDGTEKADDDIWLADHEVGIFKNPRPLAGVNSDGMESSPVVSAKGDLYFSSVRSGGLGSGDIWVSRLVNGVFQGPENVGAPVNTQYGEWNLFIEKDERYLVVEASGRPGAKSSNGDLYLYRRKENGWKSPVPLSHVNTTGSDLMPRLSPDGKSFLYSSSGTAGSNDSEIRQSKVHDFLGMDNTSSKQTLVVISRSNHEAIVLDPNTLEVISRYPTGPGPHEVAVSPDGQTIFTPNYGVFPRPHSEPILPSQMQFTSEPSDTLTRIERASDTVSNVKFPICARSHGVTVSPDGHVWVTCQNEGRVMELNSKTGALIKDWQIGEPGSHILRATRDNNYIVTSNVASGSISIFNRKSGAIRTVKTGSGAEGLVLTPDHRSVWVGNTQANTINIVNIAEGTLEREFTSHGRFPVKMVIAPDNSEAWVVNTFSNEIAILDTKAGSLIDKLRFNSPPLGIQISPDGETVYATFPRLNEVRAFNRISRQKIAKTNQVMEGDGMAWGARLP